MQKRSMIIGLLSLAGVAIWVTVHTVASSSVAARPVRLVITGPDGQQFSGTYIADGAAPMRVVKGRDPSAKVFGAEFFRLAPLQRMVTADPQVRPTNVRWGGAAAPP